ncbi:threonine/serine dehydratase [Salinicoccus siamensis]|uniref:Threonine deaminase n=1 Tax=Salinicoccus siamensis TaxID=381830 RepID=A0ABV5Z3E5_9STAP
MVTPQMIDDAAERIHGYITETPLIRALALDEFLGCRVHLKLENMQVTGSFKFRGAMNKILKLSPRDKEMGIITASSGNHGKAVAYAAKSLGIKATVVVPDTASPFKIHSIEQYGAAIIKCNVSERFSLSEKLAEKHGYTLLHPYDDADIIAGQGTVGSEIIDESPNIDKIIVPTSGGGLLGGILSAVKPVKEGIKVYGTEPASIPRYTASLEAGERKKVEDRYTIADALVTNQPGMENFPVIQKHADGILTVQEDMFLSATKLMLMEGKIFAEPSGCVGIAAILSKQLAVDADDDVCFVISGGNAGAALLKQLDNI